METINQIYIQTRANLYLHASFLKDSLVGRSWSLARHISELVSELSAGGSQRSGQRRHLLEPPLRINGGNVGKKLPLLLRHHQACPFPFLPNAALYKQTHIT